MSALTLFDTPDPGEQAAEQISAIVDADRARIPTRDQALQDQYARGPEFDPVTERFTGPLPRWRACPVCADEPSPAGCPGCNGAGQLCEPVASG